MLPARSRLTSSDEFASVIRRGRRSGRDRLVVHLQIVGRSHSGYSHSGHSDTGHGHTRHGDTETRTSPRAGLVVSKAVGGSVVRHRVSRRLRHLLPPRLAALPPGARLVVRALPPAAAATSAELAVDLDAGLRGAVRKQPGALR